MQPVSDDSFLFNFPVTHNMSDKPEENVCFAFGILCRLVHLETLLDSSRAKSRESEDEISPSPKFTEFEFSGWFRA